jgi:hypothetical protein
MDFSLASFNQCKQTQKKYEFYLELFCTLHDDDNTLLNVWDVVGIKYALCILTYYPILDNTKYNFQISQSLTLYHSWL